MKMHGAEGTVPQGLLLTRRDEFQAAVNVLPGGEAPDQNVRSRLELGG